VALSWVGAALLAATLGAVASILYCYLRTGVVPVPARRDEISDVLSLLQEAGLERGARIYELGAGWGDLALALARAHPDAEVIALELSPVPWAVAWLRATRLRNLRVRRADLLRHPLADADAVTCYLMLRPMARLAARLDQELRPGTPVVALTFWFRDRAPISTRRGPGLRGDAALYRWTANADG